MPMEFPINTFMTNTTYNTNNNKKNSFLIPMLPAHRLFPPRSLVLCFFFRCKWPRSQKVQKFHLQTCNWKSPHTHTHRYTHSHTRNKVKHVGICFYRSMANFGWCACVCVVYAKERHQLQQHKKQTYTYVTYIKKYIQTFQKDTYENHTQKQKQQQEENFFVDYNIKKIKRVKQSWRIQRAANANSKRHWRCAWDKRLK